ncbi:MAG TPA: DUF2723 domain-containing protein [Polyangiaceae bacterium]
MTVEARQAAGDARRGTRRTDALVGYAVAFAGLLLLLPRVCRTVALVGDSQELVAAGSEWGVAHAPGYPLLVSVLHVAMGLVPAHPVWAANATSAVMHAAAAGIVAVAVRRFAGSVLAGVTAGVVLLLSRGFFFASLAAEVFPLNDLLLAVLLLVALDARTVARSAGLAALAGVFGLALAHHPTIVLVGPALLGLAWPGLVTTVRERPARLGAYAAALLAPYALSYGLAWIAASRHPLVSWGDVHDLRSLARLALRSDYGWLRASPEGSDPLVRLARFARLLWHAAGPVPLALGAMGTAVLWRRSRREAGALLLAFVCAGPVLAMGTDLFQLDSEGEQGLAARFVVMPLVPLAMLAGAVVAPVEDALRRRWPRLAPLPVALPVLGAAVLWPRVAGVDMSGDRRGEAFVHDLLRGVPDGSLVLLSGDGPVQAALVACTVEHACGSRVVMAPGMLFLDWYRAELARRWPEVPVPADLRSIKHASRLVEEAIGTRPVFVLAHVVARDPSIADRWALEPSLLLVRVVPREQEPAWPAANDACEECAIAPERFAWPSLEVQTEQQLEAALDNEAAYARRIGRDDAAARLDAQRQERAKALAQWLASSFPR